MLSKEIIVRCESGLHNKQASYFVQKANDFQCGLWVETGNRKMNAKSLLGIISLRVVPGTAVTLIADGEGEKEAIEALEELLIRDVF